MISTLGRPTDRALWGQGRAAMRAASDSIVLAATAAVDVPFAASPNERKADE